MSRRVEVGGQCGGLWVYCKIIRPHKLSFKLTSVLVILQIHQRNDAGADDGYPDSEDGRVAAGRAHVDGNAARRADRRIGQGIDDECHADIGAYEPGDRDDDTAVRYPARSFGLNDWWWYTSHFSRTAKDVSGVIP